MTTEELRDLFLVRGYGVRIQNHEVVFQECVFCGNLSWNLEVNPSNGMYHCWACDSGGRTDAFVRQHLGLEVRIDIQSSDAAVARTKRPTLPVEFLGELAYDVPKARAYLSKRGLYVDDILVYDVRVGGGGVWGGRVVFPLRDYWSQETVGHIGRTYSPQFPKYWAEWRTKCVVGYRSRSPVHVVVEGVFDGIRVHQAGFNGAVLSGVDTPRLDEWCARLDPTHYVVVMLDGEAREQAWKLYWSIFPIHPQVVVVEMAQGLDPAELMPSVVRSLVESVLKEALC